MQQLSPVTSWRRISTGDDTVAVAERAALGTSARLVVWPPGNLGAALGAVDSVLAALDRQASRFREDSEISWVHRGGGGLFMLSDGLAEAVSVALEAARWTGGLADPTVGEAVISLGYDRDFAAIDLDRGNPTAAPAPVPGWQTVSLDGPLLRLPAGVRLDLGATAKGLGSDRAVSAAMTAVGQAGGVLVSLGGDIAVAGQPPRDGWPILVADLPDAAGPSRTQQVRLAGGAVATSSITCRQWRRAGRVLHHIVDPRTGLPAEGPWQTVSVAAATCADANAAATAAIVAGERAEEWLAVAGTPARLSPAPHPATRAGNAQSAGRPFIRPGSSSGLGPVSSGPLTLTCLLAARHPGKDRATNARRRYSRLVAGAVRGQLGWQPLPGT